MYRFTVDDITIGHMGDVGNPLDEQQIDFFRGIDMLLALTGGHPTMELDDLKQVIAQVNPPLVIPMHFRTLRYKRRNILWLTSFLPYFAEEHIDFASSEEVSIDKASLPKKTRVLVLDYA
jgi:hypothetical protein